MSQYGIIKLIYFYSSLYNVDPHLVMSIAKVESNFDSSAVSYAGAIGVMQVMPQYTNFSKKALMNPSINIMVGIQKLKEAQRTCKHKNNRAYLTCYNMGNTKALSLKYPEKHSYVLKVNRLYNSLRSEE